MDTCAHRAHFHGELYKKYFECSCEALRLALIGMSGAGKTFWARRIAETGVMAISCDDRIEEKLAPRLVAGGYTGINGVAAWMGWPDSATYAEREAQYLAEEISSLDEILTELEGNPQRSLILDTTGSVIYTGNHLLQPAAKADDGGVSGGFRRRAAIVDRTIFERSEAGALARRIPGEGGAKLPARPWRGVIRI